MNNLVTEPNNNNEIIENYEINLADIFQEIWKKKIFVITWRWYWSRGCWGS